MIVKEGQRTTSCLAKVWFLEMLLHKYNLKEVNPPPLSIQNISWLPLTAFFQICSVRTLPILFCKVMFFCLHHPPGCKLPNNIPATTKQQPQQNRYEKEETIGTPLHVRRFPIFAEGPHLLLKKNTIAWQSPIHHFILRTSLENGIPSSIVGEFWEKNESGK